MGLEQHTILELQDLLRSRKVSSVELTRSALERIGKWEPRLGAMTLVDEEGALRQAAQADERLRKGDSLSPLTGIPYAVKDCLCTNGVRTTCSSKILENYVPPYDATAIKRLKVAGAVMVGKNNMDEFGMGSSTENSAFFPTHNPWRHDCVPGGSSGGSAAAVAADLVPFSLGEDTGGSIRMPAAFCGVVGLKTTYGRVSRYGLLALASSFDTIGPFTRTVSDTAVVLGAIAGQDPLDSTSRPEPVPDYLAALKNTDLRGLRLGAPIEYFGSGMQPEVEKVTRAAMDQLRDLGAEIVEVSLPHSRFAIPVYYMVLFAEASANLARMDGVRYGYSAEADDVLQRYLATRQQGFGPEVKRRIMMGAYVLSVGHYDAYYVRAQQVRALLRRDFEEAFKRCDAMVTPVSPTTAFRLGEKINDPLAMYLSDIYTITANLAGIPGMSIPCGLTKSGLPIGLQLLAPAFAEENLLRTARAFERETDWNTRRPSVS
jgi:aspartyl-tRNA(Asn)/glutamyl-tRNA(Gln) amidotransferase subunit A